MKQFQLKIVTPDGLRYDGPAEEVTVRTTGGDMGIMAGHMDCVAPLGMGHAMVLLEGKKRYAACIGGMISVSGGEVHIVATAFEWADQIDAARAHASEKKAKAILADKKASSTEITMAEARLKRALIRQNVVNRK